MKGQKFIEGTGNRIRPASKEVQRERAIARIQKMTREDMERDIKARLDYGPGYGYASAGEWWQAEKKRYDLPDDLRPSWVDEIAVEASSDPVVNYVLEYEGEMEFLLSLKQWLNRGRTLTKAQYAAAKKLYAYRAKEDNSRPPEDEDVVVQFVRDYTGKMDFLLSLQKWVKSGKKLTDPQYQAAATCMARESHRAMKKRVAEVTEGMYRTSDGRIYKVQKAVHGSGNLYAKELVRDVAHGNVFGNVDQGRWKFEYVKGAIRRLRKEDKLTLEQAKEFGALYGTCCVCGRTLTDETSIAEGIGPICAGRMVEWA